MHSALTGRGSILFRSIANGESASASWMVMRTTWRFVTTTDDEVVDEYSEFNQHEAKAYASW